MQRAQGACHGSAGLDMDRAIAAAERRSYLLPDCRSRHPLWPAQPEKPGACMVRRVVPLPLEVEHAAGMRRQTQLELALLYYFAGHYEDAWEELRMMLDADGEGAAADCQLVTFRQKLGLLRRQDTL